MSLHQKITTFIKNTLSKSDDTLYEPLPIPPPYQRMLALNSDIEWTSWEMQMELLDICAQRDLETSFSFWMFSSPKATWRLYEEDGGLSRYAQAAFVLGRNGLLDTLHSFGGKRHLGGCNFTINDIREGYKLLANEGWYPQIYTNHGSVDDVQNIGGKSWASYHKGDQPGNELYHLNETLKAGLKFFWCDPDYVIDKAALSASIMTDPSQLIPGSGEPDSLFVMDKGRDENSFIRFRRFMGDLSTGPSLDNFAQQVDQILAQSDPGYIVLYQHLGVERKKNGRPASAIARPLRIDAIEAMDKLKDAQTNFDLLVTTTSRLLTHAALMSSKPWQIVNEKKRIKVKFEENICFENVSFPLHWDMLQGWQFLAGELDEGVAELRGETRNLERIICQGKTYLGFEWRHLDLGSILEETKQLEIK